MKFQKTVKLWDGGVQYSILAGELILQRGQWCQCSPTDKPCRYMGTNGRLIDVVHWQGSAALTTAAFMSRVHTIHLQQARDRQGFSRMGHEINPRNWK